jgi:hypothetical protein
MAVPREQPDATASPMRQDPKAVVLDLMNPAGTGRRRFGEQGSN